jgi:hypothetical protein
MPGWLPRRHYAADSHHEPFLADTSGFSGRAAFLRLRLFTPMPGHCYARLAIAMSCRLIISPHIGHYFAATDIFALMAPPSAFIFAITPADAFRHYFRH